jgi:predicted anti-sigma-YlaC factor YlaD
MAHQAPNQVTPRATLPPATIEELLADPSRTRGLVLESVPELLSQVALPVAALKTLEGALLSLMLSERIATKGPKPHRE